MEYCIYIHTHIYTIIGLCKRCSDKELPANAGVTSLIPRSPGGVNGNPLQYSCLGNPVDRRAWWATVNGITEELDTTGRLNGHSSGTLEILNDNLGRATLVSVREEAQKSVLVKRSDPHQVKALSPEDPAPARGELGGDRGEGSWQAHQSQHCTPHCTPCGASKDQQLFLGLLWKLGTQMRSGAFSATVRNKDVTAGRDLALLVGISEPSGRPGGEPTRSLNRQAAGAPAVSSKDSGACPEDWGAHERATQGVQTPASPRTQKSARSAPWDIWLSLIHKNTFDVHITCPLWPTSV